jgi:hypothetical protein
MSLASGMGPLCAHRADESPVTCANAVIYTLKRNVYSSLPTRIDLQCTHFELPI